MMYQTEGTRGLCENLCFTLYGDCASSNHGFMRMKPWKSWWLNRPKTEFGCEMHRSSAEIVDDLRTKVNGFNQRIGQETRELSGENRKRRLIPNVVQNRAIVFSEGSIVQYNFVIRHTHTHRQIDTHTHTHTHTHRYTHTHMWVREEVGQTQNIFDDL